MCASCRSSENWRILKKENKVVNLRYLGYITAKFHKNIPNSCWDRFASSDIPRIRYTKSFNDIIHHRLWTKVHKFATLIKHLSDYFTVKIWRGLQQKIFGKSQKSTTNFVTERIYVYFETSQPISATTRNILCRYTIYVEILIRSTECCCKWFSTGATRIAIL